MSKTLHEQARALKMAELRRHASVSNNNNHYCNDCFCCACVDIIKERYEKYINNEYRFTAPPVCTARWSSSAWVDYIDSQNGWL